MTRSRRSTYAALTALTLFAFGVRAHGAGRLGFWYDEIVLWLYALGGDPIALHAPHEPPLMAWLLYAAMWWTKSADALVLHLLTAALGAAVVPLAYAVAARVGRGPAAGLTAAAFIAVSPMAIYYARDGRPYALFMLVSAGVYLAFMAAHESNRPLAWIAFTAALSVAWLSHMLTLQIVIVLAAFSVLASWLPPPAELAGIRRGARLASFALSTAAATVLGGLWAVERSRALPPQYSLTYFFAPYPYGAVAFLRDVAMNLGPGPVGPYAGVPLSRRDGLGLVAVVLFGAGLVVLYRWKRTDLALLFGLLLVVPLVIEYRTLGYVAAWAWVRYITHVLVPFATVASLGLVGLLGTLPHRVLRAGVLAACAAVMLAAARDLPRRPEVEGYEAIARHLAAEERALAGVLVLPFSLAGGNADLRISGIHHYYRQDRLPVYYLDGDREIRRVALAWSRGVIARIPSAGEAARGFTPGRYAVLSRRPLGDCGALDPWLATHALLARDTRPVMTGLAICDVRPGA